MEAFFCSFAMEKNNLYVECTTYSSRGEKRAVEFVEFLLRVLKNVIWENEGGGEKMALFSFPHRAMGRPEMPGRRSLSLSGPSWIASLSLGHLGNKWRRDASDDFAHASLLSNSLILGLLGPRGSRANDGDLAANPFHSKNTLFSAPPFPRASKVGGRVSSSIGSAQYSNTQLPFISSSGQIPFPSHLSPNPLLRLLHCGRDGRASSGLSRPCFGC